MLYIRTSELVRFRFLARGTLTLRKNNSGRKRLLNPLFGRCARSMLTRRDEDDTTIVLGQDPVERFVRGDSLSDAERAAEGADATAVDGDAVGCKSGSDPARRGDLVGVDTAEPGREQYPRSAMADRTAGGISISDALQMWHNVRGNECAYLCKQSKDFVSTPDAIA